MIGQHITSSVAIKKSGIEAIPTAYILIDGGKGQVGSATAALAELGLSYLPMLGVAKGVTRKPGLETLYLNDAAHEFTLPGDSPALHLIQQIRDEAVSRRDPQEVVRFVQVQHFQLFRILSEHRFTGRRGD